MNIMQSAMSHAVRNGLRSALSKSRKVTSVVTGAISLCAIADATALDPQSSIGPSGSGWVALITLKGLTSVVGTVDPTALTVNITDPGFDTSGNATVVSRTLKGIAHIRRQYPNGASKQISTSNGDVIMLVSLDDWIYQGSTITSVTIGSSFYPSCVASTAATVSNLSNTPYPTPLFGWINPQQESVGNTFSPEAVGFHRHARNGQQFACMKFNINDGTNTSADVLVSSTTTSARVTQGNIPEVWAPSIDTTGMTQGTICTVNAKAYPWIGTAFDVGASGTAWPTARPITKLRVLCDRTGAYGGAYAYVKVGASAGTVSATPATAKADPYPTITAAMNALKTWNNANKSHNDLGGGFVRLMDDGAGGPQTHTIATAPANSPGNTWMVIEKDPSTAAVISVTWSAQTSLPSLVKWRNVSIVPSATTYNILGNSTADEMVAMDNCVVDNTANKTIVGWYIYKYFHNVTLTGGNACDFNGLAASNNGIAIMAGFVGTKTSTLTGGHPGLMVGNILPGYTVGWSTSSQGNHGRIFYNNRFRNALVFSVTATTLLDGMANVQNQFECDAVAGAVAENFFADGCLITVTNYVEMHVTAVGERCSRMYNDVAASKVIANGVPKLGTSKFCIWDNTNQKADCFSSGAGSVGAWAYLYGVGNVGNVSLFGQVNRLATDAPHNDNTDSPYMGCAWHPSSEYNLFRTALGFTKAQIMAMFPNYTVGPQAVPAEGGSYIPLSTASYLKSRVPVGFSVLKKDLLGTTRRTDGTGAAGCYESA